MEKKKEIEISILPNYVFPEDYDKVEKIATLVGITIADIWLLIILVLMIILAI